MNPMYFVGTFDHAIAWRLPNKNDAQGQKIWTTAKLEGAEWIPGQRLQEDADIKMLLEHFGLIDGNIPLSSLRYASPRRLYELRLVREKGIRHSHSFKYRRANFLMVQLSLRAM